MYSKFLVIMGIVLIPVLGIPAQASSVKLSMTVENEGGNVDCFYQENRHLPECQTK